MKNRKPSQRRPKNSQSGGKKGPARPVRREESASGAARREGGNRRFGGGNERRIRFSEDLIWGIHPIVEALKNEPNRISEIVAQKERRGSKFDEIVELARECGVKIGFVDSISLQGDGASSIRHQGIVAKVTPVDLMDFSDFVGKFKEAVERGEKPRVIVCDSLQDPHNIGAIVRSALASGAQGVLLTRERSAPLGGTAAKSSAGALSHMDICQVTNLATALAELKKVGAWIFGAVKDAEAISLYEADLDIPACIVVGSEGTGIRPLVQRECDVLLSIPMQGKLDSLNASVAAAVILFEAMRQNL